MQEIEIKNSVGHTKFEMSIRYPSADVKQAVRYMSVAPHEGVSRLEDSQDWRFKFIGGI